MIHIQMHDAEWSGVVRYTLSALIRISRSEPFPALTIAHEVAHAKIGPNRDRGVVCGEVEAWNLAFAWHPLTCDEERMFVRECIGGYLKYYSDVGGLGNQLVARLR